MNKLSAEMTVGEIASLRPASTRLFERYRIDFCCNGVIPLEDACGTLNLDPAQLLAEIEGASPVPEDDRDWTSASLNDLLDHILDRHHGYLKSELPRLAAILGRLESTHRYPMVAGMAPIFRALQVELEAHLWKEENVLFPLIRALEMTDGTSSTRPPIHCESLRNPIRVMCLEHDSAGGALARLSALSDGYTAPGGSCNTLKAFCSGLEQLAHDLHCHIHLENNILFPRAIRLEEIA